MSSRYPSSIRSRTQMCSLPEYEYDGSGFSSRYRGWTFGVRINAHKTGQSPPSRNCRLNAVSLSAVARRLIGLVRLDEVPGPDEQFSGDGHSGFFSTCPFAYSSKKPAAARVMRDGDPGGLEQNPPCISRSGLGDFPVATSAVGLERSRIESDIVGEFFDAIESREISDFRQQGPDDDGAETWKRLDRLNCFEPVGSGFDVFSDLSFDVLPLAFEDGHRVAELPENIEIGFGKLVGEFSGPTEGGFGGELFRAGRIVLEGDASKGVLFLDEPTCEIVASSGKESQSSQVGVGDITPQMMIGLEESLPQEFRESSGIAKISLGFCGRTMSDFGGVGEDHTVGNGFDEIPEPLIKSDSFDHDLEGFGQSEEEVLNFVGALAGNAGPRDDFGSLIFDNERDLAFVQIGTDIQHNKVLQLKGVKYESLL